MTKPAPVLKHGKQVKGTARKAHLRKAKTPQMKRNQVERAIREAAIGDLRDTIYAANARSIVRKTKGLKQISRALKPIR